MGHWQIAGQFKSLGRFCNFYFIIVVLNHLIISEHCSISFRVCLICKKSLIFIKKYIFDN